MNGARDGETHTATDGATDGRAGREAAAVGPLVWAVRLLLALGLTLAAVDWLVYPMSPGSPLNVRLTHWTRAQLLMQTLASQRGDFARLATQLSLGRFLETPLAELLGLAGSRGARIEAAPRLVDLYGLPLLPLRDPEPLFTHFSSFEAGRETLEMPARAWPVLESDAATAAPTFHSFGLAARIAALGEDEAACREWRTIKGRLAVLPHWRRLAMVCGPLFFAALLGLMHARRFRPRAWTGAAVCFLLVAAVYVQCAYIPPAGDWRCGDDVASCTPAELAAMRASYRALLPRLVAGGQLASPTAGWLERVLADPPPAGR